jgi:hypothetical protein
VELTTRARLRQLEQGATRDDRRARQAMLRLVLTDRAAAALADDLADLTLCEEPLPREHPDVRDVSRRLAERLETLRQECGQ